ncbi:hypothetical protein RvY_10094 [Ramazzottius varieornatus]|uniref:Uncharacterized protein n=1 Tax=Ramazzottius varieornatus TaxID=947166 RepID=A0A1D1VKM4_RAMVA|nr:hypothetical protein RvY_10094 [Ramazzottius varieornatus]
MADDGKTEVLYYSEVESYIENLQRFPLNEIGTLKRDEEAFTKRIFRRHSQGAASLDEGPLTLKAQKEDIDVILSVKAVGILGHLIQHASVLSLSALTRMVDHHDLPILLAGLLDNNPWTIRNGKQTFKFVNGEWRLIDTEDYFLLTQTEGQLWIALHQILLHPEFIPKYYLNEFRKNRLLRMQSLLNEALLDQLPALADLQRYLHTLTFMQTPMPKKGLIIEQTPFIRERLLRSGDEMKWKTLASSYVQSILSDEGMLKNIAQRCVTITPSQS